MNGIKTSYQRKRFLCSLCNEYFRSTCFNYVEAHRFHKHRCPKTMKKQLNESNESNKRSKQQDINDTNNEIVLDQETAYLEGVETTSLYDEETINANVSQLPIILPIHVPQNSPLDQWKNIKDQYSDCDDKYFTIQQNIIADYNSIDNFKMNKVDGDTVKFNDIIEVFYYIVEHGLSNCEGEALIKMIKNIGSNHNANLSIPKTWRTLENQCMKGQVDEVRAKTVKLHLPNMILSLHSNTILPVKTIMRDINAVIAEALLNVKNVQNFKTNYSGSPIDDPSRIIGNFTTASMFYEMCKSLKAEQGDDAVPLCLGITLDSACLNSSRSRSECPVCLYILNLVDDEYDIFFLGYAPVSLPYSEEEIKTMMKNNGVIAKSTQEQAIRLMKQKILNEYLFQLLKPIKEYEHYGMILQVGTNNPKVLRCFPQICMFSGDSEQLHKLCSVSYQSKNRKCRLCCTENVTVPIFPRYDNFEYRNPDTTFDLSVDLEFILRNKICKASNFPLYRASEHDPININSSRKQILAQAKDYGIIGGKNQLCELVKNQYYNHFIDLHKICVPDYLHTFSKGPVEYCIAWVLQCLEALGKIDSKYSGNLAHLDTMIKNFPDKESLSVFRHHKFSHGISKYLKINQTADGRNQSTGQLSGSLEGWKLLTILFKMCVCFGIGWHEMVPADHNQMSKADCNIDQAILDSELGDIRGTMIDAMSSIIELSFYLRSKTTTVNQNDVTRSLGCSALKKLILLHKMKEVLLGYSKDEKLIPKSLKVIKNHLMEHFVGQKLAFGADNRTVDTQISEEYHNFVVKLCFQRSSKQFDSSIDEMAKHIGRMARAKQLKSLYSREIVNQTEITNPMDTIVVLGFGKLEYIINNRILVLKNANEVKNYLHPLLKLSNYSNLINEYISVNEHNESITGMRKHFKNFMNEVDNEMLSFHMLGGIRIAGNPKLHFESFYLRSQSSYLNNSRRLLSRQHITSEFSFVEIQMETTTEICQILSISTLSWKENNEANYYTFIAHTRMEIVTDTEQVLPYPIYKYKEGSTKNSCNINFTHIESIVKPAFAIPVQKMDWGKTCDINNWNKKRFYILTYDTINPAYNNEYIQQISHNNLIAASMLRENEVCFSVNDDIDSALENEFYDVYDTDSE